MKKLFRVVVMALLSVSMLSCFSACGTEQPEWLQQAICEHSYETKVVIKEATCTESGIVEKYCSSCGKEKTIVKRALGHYEIIDREIDPTCASVGLTEGKHCGRCGLILVGQKENLEKLHRDKDNNGYCDTCGDLIFDYAVGYDLLDPGDLADGSWYRVISFGSGEYEIASYVPGKIEVVEVKDNAYGVTLNNLFVLNANNFYGRLSFVTLGEGDSAVLAEHTGDIFAGDYQLISPGAAIPSIKVQVEDYSYIYFYVGEEITLSVMVIDTNGNMIESTLLLSEIELHPRTLVEKVLFK